MFESLGRRKTASDAKSQQRGQMHGNPWKKMDVIEGFTGDVALPKAMWSTTADRFLAGAMVSDAFAIRADDGDYDFVLDWPREDRGRPIWSDGEYEVRPLIGHEPETVVLVKAGNGRNVAGFDMDGQTYVAPRLRGRGYGTALVLSLAVHKDGLPFEDAAMGFSPAGYAAHAAAHREARDWADQAGLLRTHGRNKGAEAIREGAGA